MSRKDALIRKLLQAAQSMVQGGLSETTRRCGVSTCICHHDPARRHGPHLYLTFRKDGKSCALYVPPEHPRQPAKPKRTGPASGKSVALSPRSTGPPCNETGNAPARKLGQDGPRHGGTPVIEARRLQRTFGEGLIEEEVADLWEDWMRHADEVLNDERLIETVYLALAKRAPRSQTFGRPGTTAEMVLRLLVLKHVRDWSYDTVEREVRANLVYREFTRVGAGKVPDAKTLGRLGRALGPEVVEKIHQRVVALAQEQKIVEGKRLRVDTTVVETNIHHPTDSSLLGDGVRVLTRTMKKITEVAGEAGTKLRNRMRSVQHRLIEIGRASRSKGEAGKEKLKESYEKLLSATGQVVKRPNASRPKWPVGSSARQTSLEQAALEGHKKYIDTMVPRVQQVIRQTKARVLEGTNHFAEKLLSIFEPTTEIIRKGKAGKPTEFGKMVKIQEAENQIVTSYEVYSQRPSDSDLLIPAIETHQEQLGRVLEPGGRRCRVLLGQERSGAQAMGVEQVAIPNHSTKSAERKRHQKKRWFRKAQKWRTGCEGRISLLKRRHGLDRCLYKGDDGMKRWVGLGVIADNLINIGRKLAAQNSG